MKCTNLVFAVFITMVTAVVLKIVETIRRETDWLDTAVYFVLNIMFNPTNVHLIQFSEIYGADIIKPTNKCRHWGSEQLNNCPQ